MVSYAGEAAGSGVSLVNMFNTVFIYLFSALTAGGAVVEFSVLFGIGMNLGVIGVAFAMCLDWMIRAAFFWARFRSGKWKEFRVIG